MATIWSAIDCWRLVRVEVCWCGGGCWGVNAVVGFGERRRVRKRRDSIRGVIMCGGDSVRDVIVIIVRGEIIYYVVGLKLVRGFS